MIKQCVPGWPLGPQGSSVRGIQQDQRFGKPRERSLAPGALGSHCASKPWQPARRRKLPVAQASKPRGSWGRTNRLGASGEPLPGFRVGVDESIPSPAANKPAANGQLRWRWWHHTVAPWLRSWDDLWGKVSCGQLGQGQSMLILQACALVLAGCLSILPLAQGHHVRLAVSWDYKLVQGLS